MKVQLLLMVKDGEESIINTLKSYENEVDLIRVFDTGSTDKTVELVKAYRNTSKTKIKIGYVEFKDFSQARNECIEQSVDSNFTWNLFVDDSYELKTSGLKKILGVVPNYYNCASVEIHRKSTRYISKRLVKTNSSLRYKGLVHEDINTNNYFISSIALEDVEYPTHKIRTVNRAVKDYKMLKNAKTERELFFKCNSAFQMLLKQLLSPHDVLNTNYIYIDCFKDEVALRENVFSCLCNSAIIQHYLLSDTKEAIKLFLTAAMTFPFRSGECYYNIYLLSGNTLYLKNAYENRYYRNSFLPINTDYYSNDKIGMIENEYNTMFPEGV